MSVLWTAEEIAAATNGIASGNFSVTGLTFDSREIIGGELFIALRGESTDGHRFIGQATQRGAAGFLTSELVEGAHVRVADTTAALEALGRASRSRSSAKIIGVTGSVGKTSVKEALKLALDRFAPDRTHASVKSYNNHTGVPLSLARMPADSRFGVFEMGMNHAGELAALTQMVRPHVAVVTWIASAHREFFATEEDIADAKGEIFAGLEAGGTAIIPFDSVHRDRLLGHAKPHAANILTFGEGEGADVRARRFSLQPDCTTVTADVAGEVLTYKVGMAGRHWLNNSLAVLAAVKAAGGDLGLAGLALAGLTGLPGRGRRVRVTREGGQAVVIDEAYNANPASMAAALAVLGEVAPNGQGRRIAVLGAMKELGSLSDEFHAGLAGAVEAANVTHAILVGREIEPLADALRRRIKVEHVADADAAIQAAERSLRADDVLLVKGSNSVGLGRLVTHFQGAEG
ncbi:UDP-N-acetylmuramoyl-tripeptide--D-alanyl-D-alanine ligase [Sphingoaurantiacus capsulatus]|uniref:UDP-N-acetylmuramoyl-tripeptide--D-alanyl-D-alanine ligase n=1 Tax=Sphingoaurantiacus capsulatus TaxID=1771310 RepID=A0ABV7XCR8_9SPHN